MDFEKAPLPSSFFLISVLGLMISISFTISGRFNLSWGTAFSFAFGIMFIASIYSLEPNKRRK